MSTIASAPAEAQRWAGPSPVARLSCALKRWWMAYLTRRIEEAAIAQLQYMSDRELKDIGLTRSQIEIAVRGEAASRPFSHYC